MSDSFDIHLDAFAKDVEKLDCPNFGYPRGTPGRNGYPVEGVCLHITGSDDWERTKNYLMKYGTNASYNYVVMADGKIIQLVPPENTAYSHGGVTEPTWPLLREGVNPNLYTASVARTGSGRRWTYPQMVSTWKLIKYLSDRFGFPVAEPYIFGHFMLTTGRWYCPGVEFWREIEKQLAYINDNPIEERELSYRVMVGSYKNLDYAKSQEYKIAQLSPVFEPEIVYNEYKGNHYYRVVGAEHYYLPRANEAKAWFKEQGFGVFIVAKERGADLPFPGEEPKPLPPEPKPPEEPKPEPEPWVKFFIALFEWVKNYFKGG